MNLIYILLFPLFLMAAGEEDGGWISGGGDPLRIYFEEGRMYAADVLQQVEIVPGKIISAEVATWAGPNRANLIDDLKTSAHEWHEQEQTTCAFTDYRRNAAIKLQFDSCRSITSAEEAAKVLIHESVHHLGIADHTFADKVAVQLVASYEQKKLKGVLACPEATPPLVRQMMGKWTADPSLAKMIVEGADRVRFSEIELKEDRSILNQFDSFQAFHGGCALTSGTIRLVGRRGLRERTVPFFIRRRGLQTFLVTFKSEEDVEKKVLSARTIQLIKSGAKRKDKLIINFRGPVRGMNDINVEAFERQ